MTACGNKMSGVCGDCVYLNKCRNNEIAKLPKEDTIILYKQQDSQKVFLTLMVHFLGETTL